MGKDDTGRTSTEYRKYWNKCGRKESISFVVFEYYIFANKHPTMRDPLIKYAYDGETGEMYDSDDLFETAKKGAEARNQYGLGLIKTLLL